MQKQFSCRNNQLMQLIQAGGLVKMLSCGKSNIGGVNYIMGLHFWIIFPGPF